MLKLMANPVFRYFVPMVFLNAFVDLGHKIIVQNTIFKLYEGETQVALTAVVNALILLPFVLLLSPSGYLSDRFPRAKVMQISAWSAVALTVAITICYYNNWFWMAFAMTFLLAIQSAIYSPAKFGYIKDLVSNHELTNANALIQATSTIAILAGTLAFSILFEHRLLETSNWQHEGLLVAIAPLGFLLIAGALAETELVHIVQQFNGRTPSQRLVTVGNHQREIATSQAKVIEVHFAGQHHVEQDTTVRSFDDSLITFIDLSGMSHVTVATPSPSISRIIFSIGMFS